MGCGSSVRSAAFTGDVVPDKRLRGPSTKVSLVIEKPQEIGAVYDMEKKEIGKGSYGKVFKARSRTDNSERAVKKCFKTDEKTVAAFRREISFMKVMDHPNIINLFEIYEDSYCIYMVMEIARGGELLERVTKAHQIRERDCAVVMRQVFRAIFYMHSQGFCHRDVKPENLMLQDTESLSDCTVKLIDFGFATKSPDRGALTLRTRAGSLLYCAPEVLARGYNELCDIWSCGVVLFLLLSGKVPFDGVTEADITKKVKRAPVEFGCSSGAEWGASEDAKDLIRACLAKKPQERASAQNALNHAWVESLAARGRPVPLSTTITDGVRNYHACNRLKRAALRAIVSHGCGRDLRDLKHIWNQLDADADGILTVFEMRTGLAQADLTSVTLYLAPMLEEMAATIEAGEDIEDRPFLDYSQFLAATLDHQAYQQEDVCMRAYRVFDINGDGSISFQELSKVLDQQDVIEAMGKKQLSTADLFKELDTSHDGVIDFSEFMAMMRSQCQAEL